MAITQRIGFSTDGSEDFTSGTEVGQWYAIKAAQNAAATATVIMTFPSGSSRSITLGPGEVEYGKITSIAVTDGTIRAYIEINVAV